MCFLNVVRGCQVFTAVFEALRLVTVPHMYSHFWIVCLMFGVVLSSFSLYIYILELVANCFFHCSAIFFVDVALLDTALTSSRMSTVFFQYVLHELWCWSLPLWTYPTLLTEVQQESAVLAVYGSVVLK